jgi:hypothetical protein
MNKLMDLFHSFVSLFRKDQVNDSFLGSEEEYDGWLGI